MPPRNSLPMRHLIRDWGGGVFVGLAAWLVAARALALDIGLPTANDALFRPGAEAAFYQPTVEGTVDSGMFGCVRRGGRRFHEGIDIKCLQRDRRGESTDPVLAIAVGKVAFINHVAGRSNYGRYVILEHRWNDVAVHSLYAHLREVAGSLRVGQWVNKGQPLGILGRSTNTREGITPDRAHVHLEIGFMVNPRFQVWYARRDPKAPPFGNYNGQNFIGLDPAALLRAAAADPELDFARYVTGQPVAFTVLVPADRFPWATLQPWQIEGARDDAAAYEVGVTGWGLPVRIWARSAVAVAGRRLPALNLVNETILEAENCRGLVRRQSNGRDWELTPGGRDWLELLTFR